MAAGVAESSTQSAPVRSTRPSVRRCGAGGRLALLIASVGAIGLVSGRAGAAAKQSAASAKSSEPPSKKASTSPKSEQPSREPSFAGPTPPDQAAQAPAKALKVAVLTLRAGPGVGRDVADLITEMFSDAVQRRLDARVMSSKDVETTIGFEKQRSALGCTDTTCLAELGGALGVDKMVSGTLGKIGGSLVISLQLIDMKRSNVEQRYSHRVRNSSEEAFLDAVGPAVTHLFPRSRYPEPPPRAEPPPSAAPIAAAEVSAAAPVSEPPSASEPAVSAGASASLEESTSPVWSVKVRGQLLVGSPLGAGATATVGLRLLEWLRVSAGAMLASTRAAGGTVAVTWIPFNAAGRIYPVISLEAALLFPSALPGVGASLGFEYAPLRWLAVGLEVPAYHFFRLPTGQAPSLLFGAATASARF